MRDKLRPCSQVQPSSTTTRPCPIPHLAMPIRACKLMVYAVRCTWVPNRQQMLAKPQREPLESPGKCRRLSQLGVGEEGGSREAREAELILLELSSSGSPSNRPDVP